MTFELDAKYAPLPEDAQAILRQKTLLGETYVELTPGTASAATLPEGGRLDEGQISETVELDEILRTFEPETREAFQVWMASQAAAIDGHGRDLNDALGNLGPFADDAAALVDILDRQEPAVQRLIRDTGVVFEALTERDDQLRELIENSNRVFATTAAARPASCRRRSSRCRRSSASRARRSSSSSSSPSTPTRWSPSCARPRASSRPRWRRSARSRRISRPSSPSPTR